MRWTNALIPTLKESPADAEITSHKLLLRAGLIRKLAGGLYTFMPLGLRVLRKVEQIVREEMDRAGALEVLMPALQPPEIWQATGRYETARDVLFKVRDRQKKEWVLGPTHEEVITTLAAGEINSYRQMPKNCAMKPRVTCFSKCVIARRRNGCSARRMRKSSRLSLPVRSIHTARCRRISIRSR
jgi:prolyl-tRNA synthetase